ncbi:glutamate--tRNA ligase [Candidatus Dependentiae bacterium]
MKNIIRTRFAPSPTGFLHLGNIRVALINYLFAHQKKGQFILRIEDTDQKRNISEAIYKIIKDLDWLSLKHDEGPELRGKYGPYLQSKRTNLYQTNLNDLMENQKVYRCFCTTQELDEKRKQQLASGNPPRYDRTCLQLSDDKIKSKIAAKIPFIWRFKLNPKQIFEIKDMARGTVKFEMKNFSDFAITRHDGSFTFMFANFVDDWLMKITHVIRGEDHLSNTAMQAALFNSFAVPLPIFWHLPMLCNANGKKLSKRDFGFSLEDLRKDGFLSQAISNYLAIIGGTFEQEIQSLGELSQNFNFDNIHSTGPIKFDIEKLTWINHKWIERIPSEKLSEQIKPFLHQQIPESKNIDDKKLSYILEKLKTDIKTLNNIGSVLNFYFEAPKTNKEFLQEKIGKEKTTIILELIKNNIKDCSKPDFFLKTLKTEGKEHGLKVKEIFGPIRYLLIGKLQGPSIHDLMQILENREIEKRLNILS